LFAHDGTKFKPVQKQFIKTGGVWREINEVYVKQGGDWNLIVGSLPAVFNRVGGSFGVSSRTQEPEYIAPIFGDSGGGGDTPVGPGTPGGGPGGNEFGGPPPGFVDRNPPGPDEFI
jgi:hypothetical protein